MECFSLFWKVSLDIGWRRLYWASLKLRIKNFWKIQGQTTKQRRNCYHSDSTQQNNHKPKSCYLKHLYAHQVNVFHALEPRRRCRQENNCEQDRYIMYMMMKCYEFFHTNASCTTISLILRYFIPFISFYSIIVVLILF